MSNGPKLIRPNTPDVEVYHTEEHIHNREIWFGKSADQSGNNWGTVAGLTAFQAISGNGDFGSDADDEAKVLGTDDTPVATGKTLFDLHRILVVTQDQSTQYILRFVWGTGTMADAITAGQYSLVAVIADSALEHIAGGAPFDIMMPQIATGTKLWVQAKNATDNATIDFLVGLHEYDR